MFNFANQKSNMKKIYLLFLAVMVISAVSLKAQTIELACLGPDDDAVCVEAAENTDIEIVIDDINKANCTFTKDGKTFPLYGKVQIVSSFPDIKVQIVDSFPDADIQIVDSFPDTCCKVKIVSSFPDVKVQIVDSFPDIKVRLVNSFPGVK